MCILCCQEAPPVEKAQKQETFSDAEEACDVQLSWPRNRQDEVTESKVKVVEAKIEREKKLLTKDLCNNSKILTKKVCNNERTNVRSSVGKKQAKNVAVPSLKSKRKVADGDYSGSSSSSDEDFVSPKLLQRKVRNSVGEEDPDFVVSERKFTTSQSNRNVKNKRVADDDESRIGDQVLGESSRRTSLARQVKKKMILADVSSDESDIEDSDDEKPCLSAADQADADEGSSSAGSGHAPVTSRKTRGGTAKQTRKRLKLKT